MFCCQGSLAERLFSSFSISSSCVSSFPTRSSLASMSPSRASERCCISLICSLSRRSFPCWSLAVSWIFARFTTAAFVSFSALAVSSLPLSSAVRPIFIHVGFMWNLPTSDPWWKEIVKNNVENFVAVKKKQYFCE